MSSTQYDKRMLVGKNKFLNIPTDVQSKTYPDQLRLYGKYHLGNADKAPLNNACLFYMQFLSIYKPQVNRIIAKCFDADESPYWSDLLW